MDRKELEENLKNSLNQHRLTDGFIKVTDQPVRGLTAEQNGMLNKTGTILVHRPEEHFMPDEIGPLKRTDQRVYGRSIVDFYTYPTSEK